MFWFQGRLWGAVGRCGVRSSWIRTLANWMTVSKLAGLPVCSYLFDQPPLLSGQRTLGPCP